MKAAGTTIRVKSVEVVNPPIIKAPTGARNSDPSEVASATGIMPKIAEIAVIKTGLRRSGQALAIASRPDSPSSFSWLARSTSKIPFFMTMPIKPIMPICTKMEDSKPK